MTALQAAIDSLYIAFSDAGKPDKIEACPCCVDEKELCTLLSLARREISPEALSSYAASAFLTAGDVPDYLYFLPRIIELSTMHNCWWPDPEVTGRAISNTVPQSWPAKRIEALQHLLHCLFDELLEKEDSGPTIDSWICAIARMGSDVRPFLKKVEQSPDHIIELYEVNAKTLANRRLSNPFWELPNDAYDHVVDWFGTECVGDLVMKTYGVTLYHSCK